MYDLTTLSLFTLGKPNICVHDGPLWYIMPSPSYERNDGILFCTFNTQLPLRIIFSTLTTFTVPSLTLTGFCCFPTLLCTLATLLGVGQNTWQDTIWQKKDLVRILALGSFFPLAEKGCRQEDREPRETYSQQAECGSKGGWTREHHNLSSGPTFSNSLTYGRVTAFPASATRWGPFLETMN